MVCSVKTMVALCVSMTLRQLRNERLRHVCSRHISHVCNRENGECPLVWCMSGLLGSRCSRQWQFQMCQETQDGEHESLLATDT